MDNGLVTKGQNIKKMGANSNPNAERIATLQERKQSIEETLVKRNQELRQLCIQEAELTGIMPTEIPLQPGESPPIFRRRIGTSFQLPQNLINNIDNEEESIASLELNMQVQANMAEAALSLANECNISKTVRRQHMTQYQYHKRQYNSLEEKLSFLKARAQMSLQPHLPLQQQKQKKKPRPLDQDDAVSVTMQQSEPFGKSVFRHSIRSLQHSLSGESSIDSSSTIYSKYGYQNLEYNQNLESMGGPVVRSEEALVSGIYRLSLNGYKAYMERKENTHIIGSSHFSSSPSNSSLYQHPSKQQLSNMQGGSHTLPHGSQRMQQPGHPFPMYPPQYNTSLHHCQSMHDYPKYPMGTIYNNINSLRQSNSSNCSGFSKSYCSSVYPNRPYSNIEMQHRTSSNPHQIQPHQQYEHSVMSTGLGGYWKRSESGELVWCNSSPSESWQRDKRFGSLDRRRNKRIHKKTSPLVDQKSATISTVTQYHETTRSTISKAQQIASRISHDNRQLVRTQSLGSVGAQTVDNVWPSDDNSSCGSDAHSINELSVTVRKQKEWFETSLDGPASSPPSRPLSIVSSTIAASVISISPEEKYVEILPPQQLPLPPSQLHKLPLEIPAESHPRLSPVVHEPNLELFNNNIPKNGTLIQAGQCKPYHEETKPFEMSDFYKYSTKFKKSPVKLCSNASQLSPMCLRNLNDNMDDNANSGIQKGTGIVTYQPLKCRPINLNNNFETSVDGNTTPNNSVNTSLNLSQLTSNVAENFSTEMNMWYQNQEQQIDNIERDDISNRSTATLV